MKLPAIASAFTLALALALCGLTAVPALSAPPKPPAAAARPEDDALTAPICSTCAAVQLMNEGRVADAKRIFERQVARGDIEAVYNLGWMYHHGRGVAVDYAKARDLYFRAANGGHNVAMNQMGFLYQHGLGVPQNLVTAYCWYTFALTNGYEPAANHIAEIEAVHAEPPPMNGACAVINHS